MIIPKVLLVICIVCICEDIDTTQEDHIYDECRYVLMENPISAAKHTQPPPMLDDPLDMDPRKDKTRFMRI